MRIGDEVHWAIGNFCQLECPFCQLRTLGRKEKDSTLERIADELIGAKVKEVTLTGNEPLVSNIFPVLKKFKENNICVSLDTNGIMLNDKTISELSGLVDLIALPIDSRNRTTQEHLRGKKFMPVWERLGELSKKINDAGIKLGYHTVFTTINSQDMSHIYRFISKQNFQFWSVQLYNKEMALNTIDVVHRNSPGYIQSHRIAEAEGLADEGYLENGYTDCLFAKFLFTEDRMRKYSDDRIKFTRREDKDFYVFIDNTGKVEVYLGHWNERKEYGNFLEEGFRTLKQRLNRQYNYSMVWEKKSKKEKEGLAENLDQEDYEQFFDRLSEEPLWVREWEGFGTPEEYEVVDPKCARTYYRLVDLYARYTGFTP